MAKSLFKQLLGVYDKKLGVLSLILRLADEISLFGRWYLDFLKRYCKAIYGNLVTTGRLNPYLAGIDKQAEERSEQLIERMKQEQGASHGGS